MCTIHGKEEKESRIRSTAEALYRKRYCGITEPQEMIYPHFMKDDTDYENEVQREHGNFSANFMIGGVPRRREIIFTEALLNELEEISEDSNVELSTLINCYLLQMLERNKRTIEHTKARRMYVKNTLYAPSTYVRECETLEEFETNIFDKDFIKYNTVSYKNSSLDEEIYIKNYLLNKGYSLEQVDHIEREEKEIQGTFLSEEGEVMNPKTIPMQMIVKECSALNFDYDVHLFIPARLGLHYILLNKVETLNNYSDIESFLKSKLKNGLTIWDLYAKYLEDSLI